MVGGGTQQSELSWTTSLGTQTTVYGRLYLFIASNPSAQISLVKFALTGAAHGYLSLNSSGQLIVLNSSAVVAATMTTAITTNAWVRVEFEFVNSTGASAATVKLLIRGNSTTVTQTITLAAGAVTFGNTVNQFQFGQSSSGGFLAATYWLDSLNLNTTGFPGPNSNTETGVASIVVGTASITATGVRTTFGAATTSEGALTLTHDRCQDNVRQPQPSSRVLCLSRRRAVTRPSRAWPPSRSYRLSDRATGSGVYGSGAYGGSSGLAPFLVASGIITTVAERQPSLPVR